MTRAFASAAPQRLRQAALAAAGSVPQLAPQRVQKMQATARRVSASGADLKWLSTCAELSDRKAMERSLTRWETSEPERKPAPKETPSYKQTPAQKLAAKQKRQPPAWHHPPADTRPRPEAHRCETAKTLPTRLSGGPLRLHAGTDPEDLGKGPITPRSKPSAQPLTAKPASPLPTAQSYPLAKTTAQKLAPRTHTTQPKHPRALPVSSNQPSKTPWQSLLAGPQASHTTLSALTSRELLRSKAEQSDTATPPQRASKDPQSAQAPKPAGKHSQSAFAQSPKLPKPANAAPLSPPPRASNSPDPVQLHREPVHGADPLSRETLSRPPHATPVPLPAQPDLDPPFAEILPPSDRAHLTRFQEAVTDEPQTELPDRSTPRATAGFDREALTDALALILRDEARRHGIDV
ncbi:hypothetical protein J7399_18110 [Shimia sp. R9_1]|uniref:hypothetical protein n=1 Tax=Shimia sp. R9_1 TaxID=2821111 RepID=UPI001ADA1C85|nr:hypothetical protein [Shimia sp. R9_1]MBO9409357.1 hypothetical protein [Shimia sp. R9_1]